jgi:anaerobic ribonucleoside-triphosphate reductase activating protein
MYENKINVAGFANDSIVDGPGLRFTLFVQGCPLSCEGCHNAQTQPFEGGTSYTVKQIFDMIEANPLLDGVTFSGGEPLCQADALLPLAKLIKQKKLSIVIYTGFVYETLLKHEALKSALELVELADTIIDGPFILKQKEFGLKFKGSKNQRIINMFKTMQEKTVVLEDGKEWA